MWAPLRSFRLRMCCLFAVVMMLQLVTSPSLAQEEPAAGAVVEKSARERDLRDQLQKILHELDELQQQPAGGTSVTPPPSPVVKELPESKASEPIPQYELADVSIVSERVQRRPEGLSLSMTKQSETESQPTKR